MEGQSGESEALELPLSDGVGVSESAVRCPAWCLACQESASPEWQACAAGFLGSMGPACSGRPRAGRELTGRGDEKSPPARLIMGWPELCAFAGWLGLSRVGAPVQGWGPNQLSPLSLRAIEHMLHHPSCRNQRTCFRRSCREGFPRTLLAASRSELETAHGIKQ